MTPLTDEEVKLIANRLNNIALEVHDIHLLLKRHDKRMSDEAMPILNTMKEQTIIISISKRSAAILAILLSSLPQIINIFLDHFQ